MNKLSLVGFGIVCFLAGYFANELLASQTEPAIQLTKVEDKHIIKNQPTPNLTSTATPKETAIENAPTILDTNHQQYVEEVDTNADEISEIHQDLPTWVTDGTDTISQQDADTFFPKPFSDIIARADGMLIDYLKQHQAEDVDYQWGVTMEQNISDFVLLHQKSLAVELQFIKCKSTICELRVLEKEKYAWNFIADDLRHQEWFEFSSSASSGDEGEGGSYLFIMFGK